jgi:hypothetical protein
MNSKLQKYYENRFDLFSQPGWQDLMEDAQSMFDTYNKVSSITDVNNLFFKKGQLDILDWLLTLKEVSEKAYEDLTNEDYK